MFPNLLVALDPFFLSESRQLRTEAPAASLMMLSLLAFLAYLRWKQHHGALGPGFEDVLATPELALGLLMALDRLPALDRLLGLEGLKDPLDL